MYYRNYNFFSLTAGDIKSPISTPGEFYRSGSPFIICQMIWLSASFLLGISGNSFVLYGTICHKALKMDKLSVWIIQNVSVADICNCVFVLFPTLITQFSGRWVFGESFCYLSYTYRYSFFISNIFLLTTLSLNKLIRCVFPLRNMSPSRKQRYMVTMVTIFVSAIPTCWLLFLWCKDVLEVYMNSWYVGAFGICLPRMKTYTQFMKVMDMALFSILDGLMCISMTLTTIILLIYACKMTNRPVVKKNVTIVITMCATFIITFLPTPMFYLMISLDFIFVELAWSVGFLSVWINPWIHFAMNKKYREFAKNRILFWKRAGAIVSNNIQQTQTSQ